MTETCPLALFKRSYVVHFKFNDYEQTERRLCAKMSANLCFTPPPPHHKTCRQLQMLSDCCLLHAVQPKVLQRSMETGNKHLKIIPVIPKQGITDLMTHTELYNCRHVINYVKTKYGHDWGSSHSFLHSLIIQHSIRNRRRVMGMFCNSFFFCCFLNV